MIGMLLNVLHGQVQKSLQKPITKGFPTIPLQLTMPPYYITRSCIAYCELQTNPVRQQLSFYKSQHVQLNRIDLIYSRPYILYAKKLFLASQNCPEKKLNLLLKNTCKFPRGIL